MNEQRPAPGWYDDPEAPGRPRWWDGERWAAPGETPAGQRGGPAPPGYGYNVGRPPVDIVGEQRSARTARGFLFLGIAAMAFSALSTLLVFETLGEWMIEVFEAAGRGDPAPPEPPMTGAAIIANVVSQFASIGLLVAGVLFVVWFHRAATVARALGLPARLSPVWAVLGFLIPIVSLWFPYQVAADLFPRDHASRRLALRWWLAYLFSGFITSGGAFLALVNFPAGLVVTLAGVALVIVAGMLARSLVSEVVTVHAELAQRTGVWGGPGDPGPAPQPVVDPWARAAERQDDPWSRP